MKPSQAKYCLPFVQAMADGKTVQYKRGSEWADATDLAFSLGPERYRIKPEPKLREWKPMETPVGALLRHQSWMHGGEFAQFLITGANERGICWQVPDANNTPEVGFQSYKDLANDSRFSCSTDNGTTWKPCGILEG